MEFYMNEQREVVRESVRAFVAEEVRPIARQMDEEDVFPVKAFRRAGELGLLDLNVPEEYGGSGVDLTTHCMIIEEVSKASAALGMCMIAHSGLAMTVLNVLGTPEQKAKWLPKIVSGETIASYAMTEPCGNGNDGAYSTVAKWENDGYRINGTKCFVTNIEPADIYIVKAVTGNPGVFSYLLVERDTPGFPSAP